MVSLDGLKVGGSGFWHDVGNIIPWVAVETLLQAFLIQEVS
jgi:hypothetical protein